MIRRDTNTLLNGFGQRVTAMQRVPADYEWSLDLFAGGGGWSVGYEAATGYAIDHACNHDPRAIACHEINHPATQHHQQSVWDQDPRELEPDRVLGYLHLSPDCTHHSKARGGRPVSDRVRGLAWVALPWMFFRRPRVVTLENVEEYRDWCPLDAKGKPVKSRKGETFDAWIACMTTGLDPDHPAWDEIERVIPHVPREAMERGLGYQVEFRELRACDYGAPTIRKRFFLIARCDGRPIRWPEPTHGPADHPDVLAGRLKPYHAAAEHIDWSLPMASIFLTPEQAKAWAKRHGVGVPRRPLKPKTQARIARGLDKFVLQHPQPYIVPIQHYGGTGTPVHDVNDPLRTITSHPKGGAFALATPYITQCNNGGDTDRGRAATEPMRTLTCSRDAHAIVAPYLIQRYGERQGQEPRCRSIEQPAQTITTTANGGQLVAAWVTKHYTGVTGVEATAPAPTVTNRDHNAVTAAYMTKLRGTCKDGQGINSPAPTLTGGGNHAGLVAAFMQSYYGNSTTGQPINAPCPTVVSRERFGLVTCEIDGQTHVVIDIAMRMFAPHELLGCQFGEFAAGYVLIGTKADQVAMIGNSVPPHLAQAIVKCNYRPRRVEPAKVQLAEAEAVMA